MRKPKTPLTVKLVSISNPESLWQPPYLGQTGKVIGIDRTTHGYAVRVQFPEEIDIKVFGAPLKDGFLAYTDSAYATRVEIVSGNPHTAYYGEWTDIMTEIWLKQ